MKTITVKQIVASYLKKNRYDGLGNSKCTFKSHGCKIVALGDCCWNSRERVGWLRNDCVGAHIHRYSDHLLVPGPRRPGPRPKKARKK